MSVASRGFFFFYIRIFFSQPLLRYRQMPMHQVPVRTYNVVYENPAIKPSRKMTLKTAFWLA